MNKIYLDHAATTYLDDAVMEEMQPFFKNCFGNPSSLYESGRKAREAVENAREALAKLLGAENKNELFFTSGGTESNNWAIKGALFAAEGKKHIITSQAEHHAVLNPCGYLEKTGCEVTYLKPDRYGMVGAEQVKNAIRSDTALVSVMYANNEVGSINPVEQIGAAARERGVLFHTDAVQAAGVLPINAAGIPVDLLSISAHKFYGPKGIGLLYIRKGTRIESQIQGGAQEREKRAGTENVPLIVGMAKALELACRKSENENRRLSELRDYMIGEIQKKIGGVHLNGHPSQRLPGNVNMTFDGVQAQISLINLDLAGIECSSGSACSSGSIDPSHVLIAMGATPGQALCTLRFSLGRSNTREEIDKTVDELVGICARVRG